MVVSLGCARDTLKVELWGSRNKLLLKEPHEQPQLQCLPLTFLLDFAMRLCLYQPRLLGSWLPQVAVVGVGLPDRMQQHRPASVPKFPQHPVSKWRPLPQQDRGALVVQLTHDVWLAEQ
mmetsp:Transcript_22866/g.44476  ORF Transcript_22866/g.44476 Transcript_22866/m.44476 type:complete len:119 (-) Transcript_22866:200-556(-)